LHSPFEANVSIRSAADLERLRQDMRQRDDPEADVAAAPGDQAKHRHRRELQIVARGELAISVHECAKRTMLELFRVELTGSGASNDVLR
jgi:hypothetical protein